MTTPLKEITDRIPHRPPFLWLDRLISLDENSVEAEKTFPSDLDFFSGHFPGNPIVPGVILCEAVFQAGALLISASQDKQSSLGTVPLLVRINTAKFKREIKPGDQVRIVSTVKERVGSVWFLKGKVFLKDKTAVAVDYACTVKTTDKIS